MTPAAGRLARLAPLIAALLAAGLFLVTLQTHVNGSHHAYATDVGEIQNALPRWGTLHFTGYPLYALTGSAAVTALRAIGITPAAGASLVSLLWGALAVAAAAALAQSLDADPVPTLVGSLAFAVSTSMWVNSSLAEVHTLTLLFTALCLWLALRFGRSGARVDLLLLALAFTQGVVHMRAMLFLAPALGVLVWPQRRTLVERWRALAVITLLAPLVYLYMPLREWAGAEWTFGQTGTWHGFREMVLDTKAERIIDPGAGLGEWWSRLRIVLGLLADDLPPPLLVGGLIGLLVAGRRDERRRTALGLTLGWLPYLALALVIWEGHVSDALLAVKLPVVLLAGVGLAVGLTRLSADRPALGRGVFVATVALLAVTARVNGAKVQAVTADRSIEHVIDTARQAVDPPPGLDRRPITLMAPWGHRYWALAYAKAYRDALPGIDLVDHNADFAAIAARGERLVTPAETLHVQPPDWWTERLGPITLHAVAPGLIEIRPADRPAGPHETLPALDHAVNDALAITHAVVTQPAERQLAVTVYWRAEQAPARDLRVAVHLLAATPPTGSQDILSQADQAHPVAGWSPTSRWTIGQVVRDSYGLTVPPSADPAAVRVTAYEVTSDGEFVNGAWLTVPVP